MEYIKLKTELSKGSLKYRQVNRNRHCATYEVLSDNDTPIGLEVIAIQRHEGRVFGDKEYPPAEFYPSAEQFGSKGFYYKYESNKRATDIKAHEKFKELTDRLNEIETQKILERAKNGSGVSTLHDDNQSDDFADTSMRQIEARRAGK
jgi:hypothetical protein